MPRSGTPSTPNAPNNWWLNCKADGTGVLLRDLEAADPFASNVADAHPDVVKKLWGLALDDAGGSLPEWIIDLARNEADVPGCSDLAARA